jgi:hypothetical protein
LAVAVSVGVQPHQLTVPETDVSGPPDDDGLLLATALLAAALLPAALLPAALLATALLAPALLVEAPLPAALLATPLLVAATLAGADVVVLPPDPLLELQAATVRARTVATAKPAVRRVDRAAPRMGM